MAEQYDAEALQRLARYVSARRGPRGLDLTHDDIAAARGPSTTTMSKIENPDGPGGLGRKTISKLETVLQWQPGSVRAVLDGGEPMEALDESRKDALWLRQWLTTSDLDDDTRRRIDEALG